MKLNLGCGFVFREGYVNFDYVHHKDWAKPDVVGKIEDLPEPFQEAQFSEIIMVHVFEHFYYTPCIKILKDCLFLLKKGGKLIIEGPCIVGVVESYWGKNKDLNSLIEQLYAREDLRLEYGNEYMHKWGWTGELLGEEMAKVGFSEVNVTKCGACGGEGGKLHHNPFRDFRVEGTK